jgi:hypothetical protein
VEKDKAKDQSHGRAALDWILHNPLVAVGLLSLVIYGVARNEIDGFYEQLQVTPEEVGLNQTVITTRAALTFAALVIELAAIGALLIWLVAWLTSQVRSLEARRSGHPYRDSDDRRWRMAWGVSFFVASLPLTIAYSPLYREALSESRSLTVLALLYWAAMVALVVRFVVAERRHALALLMNRWGSVFDHRDLPLSDESVPYLLWRVRDDIANYESTGRDFADQHLSPTTNGPSSETKLLALIFMVAVGAVLLLGLTASVGRSLAFAVIDGHGFDANRSGSLGLQAYPVCLGVVVLPGRLRPDRAYMYLGQSNDTIILFDSLNGAFVGEPLRVPASDISELSYAHFDETQGWTCGP